MRLYKTHCERISSEVHNQLYGKCRVQILQWRHLGSTVHPAVYPAAGSLVPLPELSSLQL